MDYSIMLLKPLVLKCKTNIKFTTSNQHKFIRQYIETENSREKLQNIVSI